MGIKGTGAWMTKDLIAKAKEAMKDPDVNGRINLARVLGVTQYRAQVVIKAINDGAEPEDEHHPSQMRDRISELERELAGVQKSYNRVEMVAGAMAKEIHKLPRIKIEKYTRNVNKKLDSEDIVLVVSDVHIGSWVDPGATGGLGEYSYEVFVRRLDRLITAVFSIMSYMPHRVPRIHVVFAGDIVDGARIFRGHARQTDLIVAKQVTHAYERFAHLIAVLAGIEGVEVVVSTVPRFGKKTNRL